MIDRTTALETVLNAAKKYGAKYCKFIGEGSFGCVYKIYGEDGTEYAVKVTDEKTAVKEAKALRKLREVCTVTVPKVYECEVKDGCGRIVMEYIDGVDALCNPRVYLHGKRKRRAFAEQVADGVHSIISYTVDKFGDFENPTVGDWTEYYRGVADGIMRGIRESRDKRVKVVLPVMEKLYKNFDVIFSEKVERASLIHGDLCPMNMLVDKNTLELKAFIDPLDMRYADGEYELFQLFCQSGRYFKLYETYKEKYPVSKNCDIKTAFYAVFAEAEFFLNDGIFLKFLINPLIKRAEKELKKFH